MLLMRRSLIALKPGSVSCSKQQQCSRYKSSVLSHTFEAVVYVQRGTEMPLNERT